MPVGKRKGPLPDGHPLKGGLIIVGMKKPVPLERQSTEGQPAKEEMQSDTTNTNTDQQKKSGGEYGSVQNWADDAEGSGIIDQGSISGRTDLHSRIRNLRVLFDTVLERYSGENLARLEQEIGTAGPERYSIKAGIDRRRIGGVRAEREASDGSAQKA